VPPAGSATGTGIFTGTGTFNDTATGNGNGNVVLQLQLLRRQLEYGLDMLSFDSQPADEDAQQQQAQDAADPSCT
jgi:hypothetical protein